MLSHREIISTLEMVQNEKLEGEDLLMVKKDLDFTFSIEMSLLKEEGGGRKYQQANSVQNSFVDGP